MAGRIAIPLHTGDPCRRCMGKGFRLDDDEPECHECDGTGDRARVLVDPANKHALDVLDRVIGIYEGGE